MEYNKITMEIKSIILEFFTAENCRAKMSLKALRKVTAETTKMLVLYDASTRKSNNVPLLGTRKIPP